MENSKFKIYYFYCNKAADIREELIREKDHSLKSDQLTKVAKPIFALSARRCLNFEIEVANVIMCAIEVFAVLLVGTVINLKSKKISQHLYLR